MRKPKPRQAKAAGKPTIAVSGRGKLTVQGDLNIIGQQVITHHAAPDARDHHASSWREVIIGAIVARCMFILGDVGIYRRYMEQTFHKTSLSDLADDELTQVKQYVFEARAG